MTESAKPPLASDATTALGTAPLGRLLWHTCSQTTLSVGVYGFYALTNAWFVAHGVGADAMAAVNLAAPVLLVMGAVSTTVGAGGASLVSRRLGAGDPAGAARAAGNAFAIYWLIAIAVTVSGLIALDPLLGVLGAGAGTSDYSRDYLVVLLCGTLTYTGFSSLVRAEGRQRYATALWVVAVVVQIILDPLLIYGFDLGVRGAALGTVGGQTVSALMSLWFFFGQSTRPYRVGVRDLLPRLAVLRELIGIGAPSFLAGLGATLLVVLVNRALATATVALAAYAVCARIQTFITMPQMGISQGIQPIVGYNAGRGLSERVLRVRTLALRATLGYGVLASAVLILLADPLTRIFVEEPEVALESAQVLRILAVGIAVAGVVPLTSAYFQSLGHLRPAYVISVGTLLIIKLPLVLALAVLGEVGVWFSLAAGELLSACVALLAISRLYTVTGRSETSTIRPPRS
ncbi:MATE family efflux transporter [Actinoplanes derwentensis]|uniref:Putative efflux protein, MATE family n=1 Tax=Actinoplanes derwentensis TaxID=113562 RepID=A0A1H2DER9_9ACTN|nr:MATE family efflux transporter [Actinoplanes derwentensis]GID90138.1 MATE family efflux transporter [Actinoplanes derwentensis]SDT80736.1 putative efflux protein, MATE family [Actinoplanes derwentensis]